MATQLVDWEALEKVLASKRVLHESYENALARAKQLVRPMVPDDGPVGLAIVGDARVGKSTVLKALRASHPASRLDDCLHVPVLYVEVAANTTILALLETILQALGDPRAHVGSQANRTMRVKKLLKEQGVRVLALDEFQRLESNAGARTKYKISEVVKELMDAGPTNLLVAGLPEAQRIINMNEQLRGRFSKSIVLKRFDWSISDDRKAFQSVLGQWREMFPMLDLPILEEETMAFRFYCASGGLIGYGYKILRQAIWDAEEPNNPKITLTELEYAHLRAVEQEDYVGLSPFSASFDMNDVPKLLAAAKRIGMHVEPPVPVSTTKSGGGKGAPISAQDALRPS